MSTPFDRALRGDVVTTETILRDGDVALRGEAIAAIGRGAPPPAGETLDHSGRLILPEMVDGHMRTCSALARTASARYLCVTENELVRPRGSRERNPPFRSADEIPRIREALPDRRGLPPILMATGCAERSAPRHGLWPRKGAIRIGSGTDFLVAERGDVRFDQAAIVAREDRRWSPCHARTMRARVAATLPRGKVVWNGAQVLSAPGTGRFAPRQTR